MYYRDGTDLMTRIPDRLLFVFDADAGKLSAFLDSARKALGLGACSLCALTHGLAGEKEEWRQARTCLSAPVAYLHRDELTGDLAPLALERLPRVVAESGDAFETLLTPEDLAACGGSLDEMLRRLRDSAGRHGLSID
jgi:hypothetical protein